MDRVSNRQTTWYLINIKARREQTTEHYVQVFRNLYEQDPLVGFPRGGKSGSLKYVTYSNLLDENGNPNWIQIGLLSYTIIDPEAFYNKRSREDVTMDNWNEDIVANKKETDLYFIPSVHTLAVKCNSDISLKNIVFYPNDKVEVLKKLTDKYKEILKIVPNDYQKYLIEPEVNTYDDLESKINNAMLVKENQLSIFNSTMFSAREYNIKKDFNTIIGKYLFIIGKVLAIDNDGLIELIDIKKIEGYLFEFKNIDLCNNKRIGGK